MTSPWAGALIDDLQGWKEYLAAVFPSIDARAPTMPSGLPRRIYDLVPADQAERERLGIGGVRGPVGETPVFAEIVMIVKGEVFWLVGLTLPRGLFPGLA